MGGEDEKLENGPRKSQYAKPVSGFQTLKSNQEVTSWGHFSGNPPRFQTYLKVHWEVPGK